MKKRYTIFKSLSKTDWLLFSLVMLVAIFFRFYRLGDLPLGLPADAGVNGGDAWRLLNRGGHTVFLAGNGGREAALMYLQAMAIAIFGTTPLAVRWPTALADTVSVALTFWFARWLFRDLPLSQTRWAATWAGLGMAVSHWLVVVSRLGLRAGLVPLFALLLFWSFLLAWRSGKIGWFILAGLFLGLSGYTYSAAKILPAVLILAVLPDLFKRSQLSQGDKKRGTKNSPLPPCSPAPLLPCPSTPLLRTRLLGLATTILIAAMTYLPMLIYTVTHPAQVTNRPFSVAIWAFADTPAELVTILRENLVLTAGFFCCRGNEHLILFGLPGRAAQDIALGLLLLIGIGLCLRQFGRMEPRLLVIWFLLALIPALLTTEAPHPLRLIAAAPAMVLLTVYGMHFVAQKRRWISVVFTLWLIVGGGLTFRDYFVRWPARTDMQAVFGYSLIEQAETIKARTREGEVIYIPQPLYVKPALHYYLNGPFPPQPRSAFNETTPQVTFLGELDNPAWVRLSSQGAQILPPLTQTARQLLAESGARARIDARQLAWQEPAVASDDQIGPAKLSGAAFSPIIPEDGGLEVTLFWEALAPMDEDYEILVHLLDDAGQGWSLDEMATVKDAYPTSYWRTGRDLVPDYHRLRLKDELPVGRYWLAVSIFDPAQGVRLPVVVAKKQVAPDTLFLGPLKVPLATPEAEVSETDFVVDQEFAGLARLRGYNLPDQHLIAGQPLSVELIWQAIAEVTTDYTVFVHLLDAGDNLVAGHDGQPVDGRYPTTIWSVGEFIPDLHVIDTTAVPPGQYHLAVGLYNFATGERIPVTGSADGRAILNVIIEIE